MKSLFTFSLRPLLVCGCLAVAPALGAAKHNELTAEEKAAGWELLFDGQTLNGWRSYRKSEPPRQGWICENQTLKKLPKTGGGDLITEAEFEDFELKWEWRIVPGANSGVKYFVTETRSSAIGHEYQLIDDDRHPDAKIAEGRHLTGSVYDVLKPSGAEPKPPGEWNESRVRVEGKRVEHWLNGKKILSYELESSELKAAIAQSKFKNTSGFGTKVKGHILLQDHGDEVAFRNIKVLRFRSTK